MSLKLALCFVASCLLFQLNAKPAPYKDEFTLPTDSQELIDEYLKRVHRAREDYVGNCVFNELPFTPYFPDKVDYDNLNFLCWNFKHVHTFFPNFMKIIRAEIIKEVREEFSKKGEH